MNFSQKWYLKIQILLVHVDIRIGLVGYSGCLIRILVMEVIWSLNMTLLLIQQVSTTYFFIMQKRILYNSYQIALDWRDYGAVTSIHSQGQCGACWAIAAVETIESALYLKEGKLVDLAESEVILCDDSCEMCYGGWPQNAFDYVKEKGGLPLETNLAFDDSLLLAIASCKSG